jgi:hypothetical protein
VLLARDLFAIVSNLFPVECITVTSYLIYALRTYSIVALLFISNVSCHDRDPDLLTIKSFGFLVARPSLPALIFSTIELSSGIEKFS